MLDSRFIIGLLVGIAAVYAWHKYQASQAGS